MAVITPQTAQVPKKPLKASDRKFSDVNYIFVALAIFMTWLVACNYVFFYTAEEIKEESRNDLGFVSKNESDAKFSETVSRAVFTVFKWVAEEMYRMERNAYGLTSHHAAVCIITSILLLLFIVAGTTLLAISNPFPMIITTFTILTVSFIRHPADYAYKRYDYEDDSTSYLYWIAPDITLLVLSIVMLLVAGRFTGVSRMMSKLKKSCRFYSICRYLPVIGALAIFVIVSLGLFTIELLKQYKGEDTFITAFICSVIYFGSCYITIFTHFYSKLIITTTADRCFLNENQEQLSLLKALCINIFTITKYHLGSVCRKAFFTSLWIFPLVVALYKYVFFMAAPASYLGIIHVLIFLSWDYSFLLVGTFGFSCSEASGISWEIFLTPHRYVPMVFQGFYTALSLVHPCIGLIMVQTTFGMYNNYWGNTSTHFMFMICLCSPVIYVLSAIEDARTLCSITRNAEIKQNKYLTKLVTLKKPVQVAVVDSNEVCSKNEKEAANIC